MLGSVLVSTPTVVPLAWETCEPVPEGLEAISLSHAHLTDKVLSSRKALQLASVSMV